MTQPCVESFWRTCSFPEPPPDFWKVFVFGPLLIMFIALLVNLPNIIRARKER